MGTSDITVAGLTAKATVRGNFLEWTYSDPRNDALYNIGLDAVEVWGSTTNDRATAAKVGEGKTSFSHTGLLEQTWYYWIKPRDRIGSYGSFYPSSTTAGIASMPIGLSGLAVGLANGQISAVAAASALTLSIVTLAGNTPSASDPVYVTFKDVSTGAPSTITITAALTLVLTSGSTLGIGAATAARVWVLLLNDSGTVRLGATNRYDSTTNTVVAMATDVPWSSLAEGGVGGADSAFYIYTGVAVTLKTMIFAGYVEWPAAGLTGGAWTTPPTIRLFAAGSPRPGDVIQIAWNPLVATASGTTVIPFDDTIPQSSEGDNYISDVFTGRSAANVIEHDIILNCVHSVSGTTVIAVVRITGVSNAMAAASATASPGTQLKLLHRHLSNSASNFSFDVNAGGSAAGTLYINGNASGRRLGGVQVSGHKITEIMG